MGNNKSETRVDYIDIYRGIGIILMVMGHVEFGKGFDHFIHAFHMPMFFFISGFLYKGQGSEGRASDEIGKSGCFGSSGNLTGFWRFLRRKAKSLLLPYVIFGLLHYGFWLTFNDFSLEPLRHVFYINTYKMPIAGALWFLTALFLTDIFYYLIDNGVRSELFKWILIIALATFGTLNRSILPKGVILPYALGAGLVGLGLFHLGRKLREYGEGGPVRGIATRLLHMDLLTLILSGVIVCVLIFVNGYINMRSEKYGFIPLFWLNAVLSSLVLLNLSRRLEGLMSRLGEKSAAGRIVGYVRGIGKDSIVYLCLNQEMIHIIKDRILSEESAFAIGKVLRVWGKVPAGLQPFIELVLVMLMLYFVNRLIMGTALRVVVGKKKEGTK